MSKKEKETLFFILNRNNLKKNFFRKEKDIFTLNKYVLNKEERNRINHHYPDPYKTSIEAESLFKEIMKSRNQLVQKISEIKYFKNIEYIDELLNHFLEMKISIYFYLKSIIPKYKNYILVNNGKNYYFNSKLDLIVNIEKLSSQRGKILYLNHKFSNPHNSYLNNMLMKTQSFFLKGLLNTHDKDMYFFSDKKAYFLEYLKTRFLKDKNILINYHPTSNFFRIISIILNQCYKYLINNNFKEFSITLLPTFTKKDFIEIKNNKNLRINSLGETFSKSIIQETFIFLNNYQYFRKYIGKHFRKNKIRSSFFHTIRYPDLFSFANTLTSINTKVKLISHGSHTKQKKGGIDFIASKNMALGLAYSNNKKIDFLSQSIYCDEFLESINKKYKRINYIISKKIKFPKNNNSDINQKVTSSKTKILVIGSIKPLGSRRYYYESSSEFISSIYKIHEKLSKFSERFKVYINIRDVDNEINEQILNNAFKKLKDLIVIQRNTNLKNEINNCDCIISFCSTVLEEGLQLNKPIMCFGLPKYNHFKSYEKNSSCNLSDDLKLIEIELNRKFILNRNHNRKIDQIL